MVVLIFQTFLAGKIFSQSQLDSLEIYNPYSSVDRIRKIINDNFSILSSANKAQIEAYQNSMLEDQKGNNFSGAGEKLIDIGDIYFKSGIYTNALQSYYKALNQYETNGDSINAALVKLKLARTYYFADLVPAQDFYSNAYQVLKTSNDKKILALAYYVGGLIESNQNKKSELFGKALVIQTALVKKYPHDKKLKATLATILNSNNKVEQAISIAEEIGNNWLQIVYLNNYGFDKVKSGKYDEALKIFQRSLRLCKTERNKTMLRNIYDNIARIYRLKGNWQKAAEYQQLMHYVEENLFTERFSFQVSEFKVKYDLEKKEIENTLLAKNIAIQKNLNYVLIVSVSVISIILLIVFMSKKRLKFAYALLDEQNQEISSKKIELEEINKVLHENEYNLKEAQATASLANWELDSLNNKLLFSDQFLQIFESTADKAENDFKRLIDEQIHSEDKIAVVNFFFGTNNKATKEEIEFRITKNNITKWIKAQKVSLIDEAADKIRNFGTVQDITEAKEKEKIKIEIAAQQSFSRQLIQSQEEERKRIAGELHDSLGQDILLIKNRVLLGLQNEEIDRNSLNQLNEINKSVSSVLNSIREIAFNLRPAHLERLGLTETISTVIKKFEQVSSIRITSHIDDIDGVLETENEINLFRIVQESINNIIKHSNANEAFIEIIKGAEEIRLTISDNGKGFDVDSINEKASGFGLRNIYNRIQILSGKIEMKSGYLEGTRLEITIPFVGNE
ncbi:MAG: hypothetical protein A2X62_17475 [Stygiobacter sp. GWC2_38_9]|nr:MAG: hypothetical protein A2X62_17475 [Stygiobacter sp. GWC2_38_9]